MGEKNPQQNNPLFLAYICGRKVCQGWLSGCGYSKVEGVLKLQLAREYSGRNHSLLSIPYWQ